LFALKEKEKRWIKGEMQKAKRKSDSRGNGERKQTGGGGSYER